MANEKLSKENEDDEFEELTETPKASKKKLFVAFVLFVFGFILLVLLMCWFFGIGAFAASKPQPIDRTAKTNSPVPAPVTQDEKMQMALNMVAERNPNGSTNDASNQSDTNATNSSVDIPPTKATDLNEPIIVPDPLSETNRTPVTNTNVESGKTPTSNVSSSVQTSTNTERINDSVVQPTRETNNAPLGRSLFLELTEKKLRYQTRFQERTIKPFPILKPLILLISRSLRFRLERSCRFGFWVRFILCGLRAVWSEWN